MSTGLKEGIDFCSFGLKKGTDFQGLVLNKLKLNFKFFVWVGRGRFQFWAKLLLNLFYCRAKIDNPFLTDLGGKKSSHYSAVSFPVEIQTNCIF